MSRKLYRKIIIGCLVLNIMAGSVANVAAQRRRTPAVTPVRSDSQITKRSACQGGWRGVVTITKTLQDSHSSDEPGIRKKMDRIINKTSRDYRYVGTAFVKNGDPLSPDVTAKVKFSDDEKQEGLEKVFDSCNSREQGHWFTIEGKDIRKTTAEIAGPARSFGLTVDEVRGTYSFNLKLPNAPGKYNREESLRRTGHCQAKNNEPWDRSTNNDVRIEGESVSVYNEKLDPKRPHEISGSKTWGYDPNSKVKSFIFKATWRFTRCPGELLVTALTFEHPRFPDPDAWEAIHENAATIDGNPIKVKAKVWNSSGDTKFANVSFKQTFEGDKYNGSMPDTPLSGDMVAIRLDAGEEREVEIPWNSSGYAWFDDGRPRQMQRIKAEVWEESKLKDSLTKNLKIAPKPLVLIAGLWSDANTFATYQNYLTTAHSYDWKAIVFNDNIIGVGAKANGHPRSIYDHADLLEEKVRKAQHELNAWHLDLAGHSTGGLIARLFVHKFGEPPLGGDPRIKHLIMLGTPNLGIACTHGLESEFSASPEKLFSSKELFLEEMQRFNRFVTERHGTKFSSLVGRSGSMLCSPLTRGDGVVEVDSASAGVEDISYTSDSHRDLADHKNFWDVIRPRLVTGPRGGYPILEQQRTASK